jgi:tellurite resistance protein TerC
MLALDLGVFHKKDHVPSFGEALGWTSLWVTLAVGFGGWLAWSRGSTPAIEFFTGYVIELSLSMDNVFVFVLILGGAGDPEGTAAPRAVLGRADGARAAGAMILGGAALVSRWQWILYGFGAFLVWTGLQACCGPAATATRGRAKGC